MVFSPVTGSTTQAYRISSFKSDHTLLYISIPSFHV